MKKRKVIFIIVMMIIAILLTLQIKNNYIEQLYEYVKIQKYGAPISEDGLINNDYFSISSNNTNATKTTRGINDAINYAHKHNIEYIKLQTGTYLIDGVYTNSYEVGGIKLKSNITFDLNKSTIIHKNCKEIRYSIIGLNEIENVTITNGVVVGDKLNHNYEEINSTHEWGFAIEIKSCKNININNLEIKEATGDGIIISSLYGEAYEVTDNVNVNNCNIHDCRRNGVSIICATNVNICDNEIYNINGTAPQSAIILEAWDSKQVIDNINIYRNRLYNNSVGIDVQGTTNNINIYENISWNPITVLFTKGTCKIFNNTVNNSKIEVAVEKKVYEGGRRINKAIINNNKLIDSIIYALNVENLSIMKNEVINSNISVYNSDCLIHKNIVKNENKPIYWAFRYYLENENKQEYNLYLGENVYEGNYNAYESIINSNKLNIHTENIEEYKNEFIQ